MLDGGAGPLDGLPAPETGYRAPLITAPFNPLQRTPIEQVLDVGVRTINGLLTVGRGQRMGLFAGSGVGKKRAAGHDGALHPGRRYRRRPDRRTRPGSQRLYREYSRRRRTRAFSGDRRPGGRIAAAAHAGAPLTPPASPKIFRDRGQHVLLIMDSLTRYAMAQREIALAIGEPPATKGYPPSVFAKLPALVERAGNGISGGGSITAFYTVLTEGDDQQDPIADSARAILDGHVVLSRRLAEAGHYPAIDIEASISRAMTSLIDDEHYRRVRTFKQMLASFQRNRDLISVGAYAAGSDPLLDKAITLYPQMETLSAAGEFFERCGYDEALSAATAVDCLTPSETPRDESTVPFDYPAQSGPGGRRTGGAALGRARRAQQAAEQQLTMLLNYQDEYRQKLNSTLSGGMESSRWQNYQQFIATLEQAIEQQRQQLLQWGQKVDHAVKQWQDHQQRLNAYDTPAHARAKTPSCSWKTNVIKKIDG